MRERLVELLTELCALRGVSGQEQEVARWIYRRLQSLKPDVLSVDNMGNIYATRKGKGAPGMMLLAHLDEVGAIVSRVCDNGLLRFKTVGVVNAGVLASLRVRVGELPGTVSAPPAHTSGGAVSTEDLFIDIGAASRQEALEMGVDVGTQVTFDSPFVRLTQSRILSRVIDDRVGCAILLYLFESLDFEPEGDFTVGFSIREETTMTGARMLVEQVRPDWAVAIDTVPMKVDASGVPLIDIGHGPVFQVMEGVMSAFVGNCAHPAVLRALRQAACEEGAPYQMCAEVGSWTTDGAAIHAANKGTPSGYLSIPRRYAHSPSEVMDIDDAVNAVLILKRLLKNMGGISLGFI